MTENFKLPESSKILEQISAKKALAMIIGLSFTAVVFLFWLIYFNEGSESAPPWIGNLSAVNAGLNSLIPSLWERDSFVPSISLF